MAVTIAEMLKIPTAQCVGGNIIIGEREEARIIATNVEGVFGLTDAGREYFAAQQEAADEEVVTEAVRGTRGRKPKVALDETPEIVVQDTTSTE